MAESSWVTLKFEYLYRHAFSIRAQVHDGVSEWIEVFYNRCRRHSAIGYISPVAYGLKLNQRTTVLKSALTNRPQLAGKLSAATIDVAVNKIRTGLISWPG